MATNVEVALIGDPAKPGAEVAEAEWAKPWNERLRVELTVEDHETLDTLSNRALTEFGVDRNGLAVYVDLGVYVEGDRVWTAHVGDAVVDDDGKVLWNVGAVEAVRERLGRGRETTEKHMHRWAQRGTYPNDFARWLHRDTWSAETLAGLLGCPQDEAEAILALFGFAYSDDDALWHRGGDPAGRLLEAAYDEAAWLNIDTEESRAEFESRVESMLRTGEMPAERKFELAGEEEEFVAPMEIVTLAVSPEGIAGHGRFGGREVQVHVPADEMAPDQAGDYGELLGIAYRFLEREIARLGKDAERWSRGDEGTAEPEA